MSACADRQLALSAYLDAELDLAAAEELELHLAGCAACRADLAALDAVSDAVRRSELAAPETVSDAGLRADGPAPVQAIAAAQPAPVRPAFAQPPRAWRRFAAPARLRTVAAAAVVVLAVAVGYGTGRYRGPAAARDAVTAELLSAHLRALLPGRLVDVESSDRHQVKPWFAGRLDFSPPVPDLSAQGFPLLGGRLDFVQGRRAAVLVYGRRLHRIDVFVVPVAPGAPLPSPAPARLGYNFVTWQEGPLAFMAVSDVSPGDLRALASLLSRAP